MDDGDLRQTMMLLRTGKPQECFNLIQSVLAKHDGDLLALAYRGIARGRLGDISGSLEDLKKAGEGARKSGEKRIEAFAAHYLGNQLVEANNPGQGLKALERAATLGLQGADIFTSLCQAANQAGDRDKARVWGEKALASKDRAATCEPEDCVAPRRPKPFDPSDRKRNIVAYSLFGDDDYYFQCAVTNARVLPFVYPEFTARFYCSRTVPKAIIEDLARAGAQVLIPQKEEGPKFAGLFWRFLPFDDPGVDCVLIRDVDSPILPRERAAMNAWLASDKPFHVMRDHVQHNATILAGLWGGFTGLLPKLGSIIDRHVSADSGRFSDQAFLRKHIWPRIRDATLAFDSQYKLRDSVDFPEGFPNFGNYHVGIGWNRKAVLGAAKG